MSESDQFYKNFHNRGYLIVEDFISDDECKILKNSAKNVIDSMEKSGNLNLKKLDPAKTLFSSAHHWDTDLNVLFSTAENTSFFWEKDTINENFELVDQNLTSFQACNRLGFGLHFNNKINEDLGYPMREIMFAEKSCQILEKLKFQEPKIVESSFIFKNAGIGDALKAHRNAFYLYNEKKEKDLNSGDNILMMWLALDDADLDNF